MSDARRRAAEAEETGDAEAARREKSAAAFRTISEVAAEIDVPPHVLRFWETKFTQVAPMKRGGGRRYYRPSDVALLKGVRRLLYDEGLTIKGLQKLLKERGPRRVAAIGDGADLDREPSIPVDASEGAGDLAAIVARLEMLRDRLRGC